MPEEVKIDTPHKAYTENLATWLDCRTLSAGQRAVKAEKDKYLPKLGGQTDPQYLAYLKRASYFNAAGRTVQGLVGVVFRKEPVVSVPKPLEPFIENVTVEGASLEAFARGTFEQVVTVARYGVLLDWDEKPAAGDLPHFADYWAEAILNWRVSKVNGVWQLSLVVLKEVKDVLDDQGFVVKTEEIIRVLHFGSENSDGESEGSDARQVYKQDVYKKADENVDNKNKWVLDETVTPLVRGKAIEYIPFVFFGPIEASSRVQKSMIEDLCDVNLSHYLTSADLEHGRHFTALPTAWVAGFPKDMKLAIGPETVWISENENANAGFLEYTGQGLQALEKAMETKEAQMAILGARMLEAPKRAVEASDTHKQRQAGEQSVLASAANATAEGFITLLTWANEWISAREPGSDDINVEFNTDYMPMVIDSALLDKLMLALQGNMISWETFSYNLQKGELYPDGLTSEEEWKLIEKRKEQNELQDITTEDDSASSDVEDVDDDDAE